MDLTKAQKLLAKVQTLLDQGHGNELSRLEKDLLKSYIIQLYDAVSSDVTSQSTDTPVKLEIPVTKSIIYETPVMPEMPKPDPSQPIYVEKNTPVARDIIVEKIVKEPEPVIIAQKSEPKPVQIPINEPVRETVQSSSHDTAESLASLFELPKSDEMSGRVSHIPIASIESAMGLNEKIFTLNELFGGDKGLFELTCSQLNNLSSFYEAKILLLNGPARHFNWSDPQRTKMAEQFIRIVARRYPKS